MERGETTLIRGISGDQKMSQFTVAIIVLMAAKRK
jgi:hypothetical protein